MESLNAADAGAFRDWLNGLDDFLVDCDGVLWRGNDGVPGVADTVTSASTPPWRIFNPHSLSLSLSLTPFPPFPPPPFPLQPSAPSGSASSS
jgi:hypothetical protein